MTELFAGLLRIEDVVLIGWTALGWPLAVGLLGGDAGAGDLFDAGHPVRGLAWTLAAACALVVLASRESGARSRPTLLGRLRGRGAAAPPGSPGTLVATARGGAPDVEDAGDGRLGAIGPLVGGLSLVAGGGFAGLGLDAGIGMGLAFVGALVATELIGFGRAPALARSTRRWLVTPFLLVTSGLFTGTMAMIGFGPDLLRSALGSASAAAGPVETLGLIAASLGLFVVIAAVYYAMLVFAPRRLVDPEGGALAWLARFACFVAGSLTGAGVIAALGF